MVSSISAMWDCPLASLFLPGWGAMPLPMIVSPWRRKGRKGLTLVDNLLNGPMRSSQEFELRPIASTQN